ncbi:MAG: hypothetical protein R3A52_08665 [Polyangiales bacterium]
MLWTRVEGDVGYAETLRRRDGAWSVIHRDRGPDPSPRPLTPLSPLAAAPVTPFDGALCPRALRLDDLPRGGDALSARLPLLVSDTVRVDWLWADADSPRVVDLDHDQCLLVVDGDATLDSPFGALRVGGAECAFVPRGVVHRLRVEARPLRALLVSFATELSLPEGAVVDGLPTAASPLSLRDARGPRWSRLNRSETNESYDLDVLRAGSRWRAALRDDPLRSLGWEGRVSPFAFGWEAPLLRSKAATRTLVGDGCALGFRKGAADPAGEPSEDRVVLATTSEGEVWLAWEPAGAWGAARLPDEAVSGQPVVTARGFAMTANLAMALRP